MFRILFCMFVSSVAGTADALACGQWWTNECLGKEDKRYDPTSSVNLVDQHMIWSHIDGYFMGDCYDHHGPEDLPTFPEQIDKEPTVAFPGWPYPEFPYAGDFWNLTVSGSRFIQQDISIYDPADPSFCQEPVPEGKVNVVGDGTCGINGNSVYLEMYGTSSYEKDGSVSTFVMGETSSRVRISSDPHHQAFVPVNNRTLSGTVLAGPILATFEWVFLDADYNSLTINAHMYDKMDHIGGGASPVHSFRTFLWRVSEEEWLDQMNKTYEKSNVLVADRPQEGSLYGTACLSDACPTRETWCKTDPSCSQSPYQEPEGTIKASVLVGFLAAFFTVIVLLLYMWHLKLLAEQAARNRKVFVNRVARSIRVSVTSRTLTPTALAKRFDDIDSGGNRHDTDSYIDKEELWEFMRSGEAGDMSKSDFEALFQAMDDDGNGKVDFLEFCAFLGQCSDELEAVNLSRGQQLKIAAQRISTANISIPASVLEEGYDEEDPEDSESTPLVKK